MNQDEHKTRHQELHRMLDELLADFLRKTDYLLPSKTPILTLLEWSFRQTKEPDHEATK